LPSPNKDWPLIVLIFTPDINNVCNNSISDNLAYSDKLISVSNISPWTQPSLVNLKTYLVPSTFTIAQSPTEFAGLFSTNSS